MPSPPALPETRKATLRATALAARDALSSGQRAAAAQAVALRGVPFEIVPGTVVAGYQPIRSEIDPVPLRRNLAVQGARLALPAVMAGGQPLEFCAASPHRPPPRGPLRVTPRTRDAPVSPPGCPT